MYLPVFINKVDTTMYLLLSTYNVNIRLLYNYNKITSKIIYTELIK